MDEHALSTRKTKPALLKLRSSKWLIGFTVFVAAFNDGFGYGAIVPVLPFSLVERSGVREKDVQFWLSTLLVAFGLSLALAAPFTAWAGDKLGNRRMPMILGSLLALVGTAVFCIAEAPWLLVVARLCQGASNAAVYSAGLPLIADTVSSDDVGSWMGFVFSGMTGGFLVSPFLAGIVYAKAGYLPVFILVFAALAFDLFLRIIIIEKKPMARFISDGGQRDRYKATPNESSPRLPNSNLTGNNHHESDPAEDSDGEHRSSGNSTVNGTDPDKPPKAKIPLTFGSQLNPAFWFRNAFPRMATLLNSPRLSAAVYGCFTYGTVICSFDAILPLFVHRTFGWDSQGVGLIFLALTVPALAGAAFGAVSDRYGPKRVSLSGFVIASVSLALLALVRDDSNAAKAGLTVLLFTLGTGMNLILTPLAADMLYEANIIEEQYPDVFGDAGTYALVYSFLCVAFGLATSVGPAWSGFMFEDINWAAAMISLVAFCLLGGVGVFFYTGGAEAGKRVRLDEHV
ncbi:MAG: hypothetical protein L6R38_008203 [Xanthoria sp. 2 TBL-2021]|nr:MAG: hypothetical protein L6R38_008203 [Xanthoria sp. 2 TBL-2021]